MILSGGVAMSDPKSLGTRLSARNSALDGINAAGAANSDRSGVTGEGEQ